MAVPRLIELYYFTVVICPSCTGLLHADMPKKGKKAGKKDKGKKEEKEGEEKNVEKEIFKAPNSTSKELELQKE